MFSFPFFEKKNDFIEVEIFSPLVSLKVPLIHVKGNPFLWVPPSRQKNEEKDTQ